MNLLHGLHGTKRTLVVAAWAIALVGLTVSIAEACNVPVFRYALEHWRPDAYRAVLYHRGPLSTEDQERLTALKDGPLKANVNLSIRAVDLEAAPQPGDQELWSSVGKAELPRLVIQYPAHLQIDKPVWSIPFGDADVKTLLDSPLRQEALKRLTSGQTAVWLMVDSGDSKQDDQAAATLELELKNLQKSLKLPELTDSPDDVIQDGPPLRVEFSMLRVRRHDPAEQGLVAMLLGSEADLATLQEPLVFPVFGRGRAMLPLVGAGISQDNIRGSAAFLAGACSCQVKELNPGFDLLLTADWKELLSWAKSPAFAEQRSSSQSNGQSNEPELVPIPAGSKSVSPAATTETTKPEPQDTEKPEQGATPVVSQTSPTIVPESMASSNSGSSLMMVTVAVIGCLVLGSIILVLTRRF